jgi:hypothetical protein
MFEEVSRKRAERLLAFLIGVTLTISIAVFLRAMPETAF